jgi:glycosyltransferase involved in cell wall biosynthesis
LRTLLLIGPSPTRAGGVATYLRHLTAALADEADTNWAFFATDKGKAASLGGRLAAALRVARDLKRTLVASDRGIAHICCGSDGSGWGLREGLLHAGLCQRAGLRTLLHLHASALPELLSPGRADRGFLIRRLASADALAVPSEATRALLVDCGISEGRVCVIPNAVPLRPWAPRLRPSGEAMRLLFVGSIETRKGVDVLLEALSLVGLEHPGALRVDAYGPPAAPKRQLRQWSAAGESVGLHFCGAVSPSEVQRALSESCGLVLPSLAECQPFALLEAMAASRPVLATDCGGVSELLSGGAGDCVPPGDAAALAAGLRAWLTAPERLEKLARTGWERIRDQHSIEAGLAATKAAWRLTADSVT